MLVPIVHSNFTLTSIRKSVLSIRLRGLENFSSVRAILVARKLDFHTHTPKALLPYSVVIRGLSSEFSTDEIVPYLHEAIDFKVEVLGILNLSDNMRLVRLSKDSDIQRFYRMDLILHCKVRLRKDRGREVIQCYNCQRFGQVSANCGMSFPCVKCAESHVPSNCPIPPKSTDAPYPLCELRCGGPCR